jgi:hypothetical protein
LLVRARVGLLALLHALGCSEDQLPILETEHLRFHGELDGTCEALGTLYERELARIEASLGRELIEPIDIYMGEAEVERRCNRPPDEPPPSGCAPSGTLLATTLFALSHELVHALRKQHGVHGVPLIEEGLATMLGTARPSVPLVVSVYADDPDAALIPRLEHDRLDDTSDDDSIGAHFLHWVGETYGREPLLTFLWSEGVREGDPAAIEAAFAEAIGEMMLAAQDRWSDEAEHDAKLSDLCYGIDTVPLPAAGLRVEGPACCTDLLAEQGDPGLLRLGSRCFTLTAPTELRVDLLVGEGLVLRPDGCDGDLVVLDSGESATFTAEACRWKVMAVTPEDCDEPMGYRYAVTPL